MRFNPDEYVTVAQRIEKFYAKYPQGRLIASVLERNAETGFVLIKAEAYREPDDALPAATGHAYEVKSGGGPQSTSYIEVCETSAVGRALALLGFEVKRGVASREEVEKAARKQPAQPQSVRPAIADKDLDREIMDTLSALGKSEDDLNGHIGGKYDFQKDWTELDPARKREVLSFLKSKLEKEVAAAR